MGVSYEDDKKRMQQLLLAIEFENLANDETDLIVKNVRIFEYKPNPSEKLFSFILHKKSMIKKLNDENSTLLLTSGHTSAPNLHIATVRSIRTVDDDEGQAFSKSRKHTEAQIIFHLSPTEQTHLRMFDRYNIRLIVGDFSLSWGYKALKTLLAKNIESFVTSFESSRRDLTQLKTENQHENQIECSTGTNNEHSNHSMEVSKQPEHQNEDVLEKNFEWANSNVAQNEEQKLAIKKIVTSSAKPLPFIVFGPPGKCDRIGNMNVSSLVLRCRNWKDNCAS